MSIPETYLIRKISQKECHEWFLYKHYLKRLASFSFCFGLFENSFLKGVCSFGRPASHGLVKGALSGKYMDTFLELNRLVVEDNLTKNVLSFFLSQSLQQLPRPNVIVSYADSAQGHHGYIYQATNWIYTGLSAKRKDYKIKGFEDLHSASLMDREGRNIGKGKVLMMKEKYGDSLYTVDRPRKHRYFYLIGNKKQKKEMKKNLAYKVEPYPKGQNKNYDSSYQPSTQLYLAL